MTEYSIEARLDRLEAESQIRQLIARYCIEIDNRALDKVAALFTEDAVVKSADGVMNAKGVENVIEQYRGRFTVLGAGAHYMHDISIDELGETEARGRVSGHAELWRKGQMMVAGLRYNDAYRKTGAGWRFAEREICYLYYVPLKDYPGILGTPNRNHAYDTPAPADFPEKLPSWKAYDTEVAAKAAARKA